MTFSSSVRANIGTAIVLCLALVLSACSSTSSSTSGYFVPSVSVATIKKEEAAKLVATTKSELRKVKKKLKSLERQEARDQRRLKRRKISDKYRAKVEARMAKRKGALRGARRDVVKAQRAHNRALWRERRADRRLAAAERRKNAIDRRVAEAKKRDVLVAVKKKSEVTVSSTSAFVGRFLFRKDPALQNVKDYRARTDSGYDLAAIPVKKMKKRLLRQQVNFKSRHKAGTLVVDTKLKYLYLVQNDGRAMRYGIGVGKAGFEWSGSAYVGWKKEWPTWTPPAAMISRRPELRKWSAKNGGMPPGTSNPLGARALYLMRGGKDTLYRLHGTPEWYSIGTAASSGCIRLMNQDIIDLYERVPNGAKVVVL